MTKNDPIISPKRVASIRGVFDQMLNQLETLNINPTHFCGWISGQST